jgi:hypothetical protein
VTEDFWNLSLSNIAFRGWQSDTGEGATSYRAILNRMGFIAAISDDPEVDCSSPDLIYCPQGDTP